MELKAACLMRGRRLARRLAALPSANFWRKKIIWFLGECVRILARWRAQFANSRAREFWLQAREELGGWEGEEMFFVETHLLYSSCPEQSLWEFP